MDLRIGGRTDKVNFRRVLLMKTYFFIQCGTERVQMVRPGSSRPTGMAFNNGVRILYYELAAYYWGLALNLFIYWIVGETLPINNCKPSQEQ